MEHWEVILKIWHVGTGNYVEQKRVFEVRNLAGLLDIVHVLPKVKKGLALPITKARKITEEEYLTAKENERAYRHKIDYFSSP